jgi:hypothetical protein
MIMKKEYIEPEVELIKISIEAGLCAAIESLKNGGDVDW